MALANPNLQSLYEHLTSTTSTQSQQKQDTTPPYDGTDTCPMCTDKGKLWCGGCRNVSYCSKECQEAEWPTHKVLCKTFKDFEKRPSENMRRIVVLMPNEEKPRFMWVEVSQRLGYQAVDNSSFFPKNVIPFGAQIFRNEIINTPVAQGFTIEIKYDDEFMKNYHTTNKAVVAATNKKLGFEWRGPIYAFCCTLRGGNFDALDMTRVRDMDMRTYSDLVAYLTDYYNDKPEHKARKGGKVMAVRINCDGEREDLQLPHYQVIGLPRTHPMFHPGAKVHSDLSSLSKRVGMPLKLTKYKTDANLNHSNVDAAVMMLSCDPSDAFDSSGNLGFGYAPLKWDIGIGSVLMIKEDGKSLSEEVLKAFVNYCRTAKIIFCRTEEQEDDSPGDLTPQQALAEITPANWQAHLAAWQDGKGKVVDMDRELCALAGVNLSDTEASDEEVACVESAAHAKSAYAEDETDED